LCFTAAKAKQQPRPTQNGTTHRPKCAAEIEDRLKKQLKIHYCFKVGQPSPFARGGALA
jgi:hypothetical protein